MSDPSQAYDVIVIGAGPSGMMAAIASSLRSRRTLIIEKNEKPGKKLFITGKGRCNLTNACEREDIFAHIVSNPRFMYSSISSFDNKDVSTFFEERGLRLKTERGLRVFPVSDHSSDVIKTLTEALSDYGAEILYDTAVKSISIEDGRVVGLTAESRKKGTVRFSCESVIVATGGLSYPATGSTGDGYRFADRAGLSVTDTYPSLVSMVCKGEDAPACQGLTLKNVKISFTSKGKTIFKSPDVGELLFTHEGVSGPLILTASSEIPSDAVKAGLTLHIDLKPALSPDELDRRIIRDLEKNSNRDFRNSLSELLPSKLIPVVVKRSEINGNKKVNMVTREERKRLTGMLKDFMLDITSFGGYDEAVVTKGGVSVKELDPATMETRRVKGLYFAGEVIDVDAHTGGYNLQIAWSTGHAAGSHA